MALAAPTHSERAIIRVAIAEQGLRNAAGRLRGVLASSASFNLISSDPLENPGDGSFPAADVVLLTWDGRVELGATIAAVHRSASDAALVVLVPAYDESLFVHAIRLGAEDCVAERDLDERGLVRLLLVAAERHRVTSSLRAAAFTDDLTGLYNRRGYLQRAAALLRTADSKAVWQIFFDVDDLKQINDTFGHWAGDRALMEVSGVLRQAFRSTDIVARVGGDEFAVLAVAPADAAPDSWTARWREPLAALGTRREFPLSVSVGVAQPDEHRRTTAEDLLDRADATMYVAKRLRKKFADAPPAEPPTGEFMLSNLVSGTGRRADR
ncbi:MAG TPA: GGDEF domain-containing protein [Gemmatimonadaceae bacterium]|nr:GGDEF domain-containing protein [Gemmatimonadaceae bacterium]